MKQNAYAIVVFLALCISFAVNPPGNSGEWASWVQALGSIAAILGAVWIARAEDRRRFDEGLTVAEITAVEVLGRLGAIHGCTGACIDAMSQPDVPTAEFDLRRRDIDELSLPNAEDVRRLVPIGNAVAIDLAQILTVLSMARVMLERGGRHGLPLADRQLRAKHLKQHLTGTPEQAEKIRSALIGFLERRGHQVTNK